MLEHYRRSGWSADVVLLTGDVIQDDTAGAYRRCRELLEPLGLPVYSIPGNHDVRSLMRTELASPPFHYLAAFERANWLVAGIDSCSEGRAGGRISHAELRRLARLVANSEADHAMVCLHHPPVPMQSEWLDRVGLDDGAAFIEQLEALGTVRLALFGHVHQEYDSRHGSVRVIGTPSTCRQFAPGSNEFEVDERPPAYRRFELRADGSVSTEVLWVDS